MTWNDLGEYVLAGFVVVAFVLVFAGCPVLLLRAAMEASYQHQNCVDHCWPDDSRVIREQCRCRKRLP